MGKYNHPEAFKAGFDFKSEMRGVHDHIMSLVQNDPHPGQAQHLGGAASYYNHLDKLRHGEAHAIKKELKHVIDYLYCYTQTKHEIYLFFAEDALKHVCMLKDEITDEAEKKRAECFVHAVVDYLAELSGKKSPSEMPGMNGNGTISF